MHQNHSLCNMKKIWLVSLFVFVYGLVEAQPAGPAARLKEYPLDTAANYRLTPAGTPALYAGEGLHYLQPLYEYFKQTVSSSDKNRLARHLAMAGDHLLANYYLEQSYDSMMAIGYEDVKKYLDTMGKLQLLDARSYILQQAAKERIVLFNENAAQLQQRAYFYTLLEDFYKLGFRYLSLYWLSPLVNPATAPVNKFLGYQVADPIAAEIIRKAKQLGFTLVAYGDSSITRNTGNVQDAVQASRLASLLQQDTAAKILVLDEQAHIAERPIGSFTPMGTVLQRLTGIDPFTIDQTELSSGSSFEYGRYFYAQLVKRIPVDQVSVVTRGKQPVSLLENDLYDIQLLFPSVQEKFGRADWLSLSGNRKMVAVQPAHRELFLVQAYYKDETFRNLLPTLVPADQTYLTDRDGYYRLYLQPGSYTLIFRDIHYQVLTERDLEVK